ncbi:MAG TPA: ABC transporter ATP-binding protein [Terriglobia bacterium]|nr:ABC transporter ATP-binding protein [Terriglobia bacterium]
MSQVEIINAVKKYGELAALDHVSMTFKDGEFFGLLGPSGSGKTTMLRAIAGFVLLDEGEVRVDGKDIGATPVYQRNIGMVFQNYALFPHMSVAENVAFGLDVRRIPAAEQRKRVADALAMVRLVGFEQRKPKQLSGGQQQRVALARALVTRPRVLLLDEPLGALDKHLRQEMQIELKRIQRDVGITTVFVTHDQEEALTLSDRIAIFNAGSIIQAGSPGEVYARPINRFAAGFLGEANFLSGKVSAVTNGWAEVALDGGAIASVEGQGLQIGLQALLAVRPERMAIHPGSATAPGSNRLAGTVGEVIFSGNSTSYRIHCGPQIISVFRQNDGQPILASGAAVNLTWEPDDAVLVAE